MKKLRLVLFIAVATLGFNACTTSPVAPDDDCNPEVQDCGIKPTSGS
ncbi:MAG: hypothetical protein PVI57_06900 [Gemmatimonadota bacterium]|jgi:hypothetical protein